MIEHIDLLPALFGTVVLPAAVQNELKSGKAPASVRQWGSHPPAWIEVRDVPASAPDHSLLRQIDAGEKAAIQLAELLHADLLLMDDRKAVSAAEKMGLRVTGTLGVLDLAADRGLVDFARAVQMLEQTNFRRPEKLLDALQIKHQRRTQGT